MLVFGDSYSKDIIPAEKAGCQVMWIKGKGWTKEEDDTFHPNIIRSLDEGLGVLLDAWYDPDSDEPESKSYYFLRKYRRESVFADSRFFDFLGEKLPYA